MAQTKLVLTFALAQTLMNKRRIINANNDGQQMVFSVVGNGTIIPMLDGDKQPVLDDAGRPISKRIFNVNAASGVALSNPAFDKILFDAVTAEQAGDEEQANDLYREYLNKTQVSFSVPDYKAGFDGITDGDEIKAHVQLITTDKGQILTLDKPVVKAAVAAPMANISLEDKLAAFKMSLGTPAPKAAPAGETPAQKKARERREQAELAGKK